MIIKTRNVKICFTINYSLNKRPKKVSTSAFESLNLELKLNETNAASKAMEELGDKRELLLFPFLITTVKLKKK